MITKVILYIHGKGGQADEAKHYEPFFPNSAVIGLDYQSQTPWEAQKEFADAYYYLKEKYKNIDIIANSIGAYLAMHSLLGENIRQAFFISPIVNMEKLITNMMHMSDVSEAELQQKQTVRTKFGETLSWRYLEWVRTHQTNWKIPTHILYGSNDNLQTMADIQNFALTTKADITVMKNGEHWFHTDEQMNFLDNWLKQCLIKESKGDTD